jgi:hypothetical protein
VAELSHPATSLDSVSEEIFPSILCYFLKRNTCVGMDSAHADALQLVSRLRSKIDYALMQKKIIGIDVFRRKHAKLLKINY